MDKCLYLAKYIHQLSERMKLAIVTNQAPHHKYFVYSLYEQFEVSLVLHPNEKGGNIIEKSIKKKLFSNGFIWFLSKLLSLIRNLLFKGSLRNSIIRMERRYFNLFLEKYDGIPKDLIKIVQSVNDPEIVER